MKKWSLLISCILIFAVPLLSDVTFDTQHPLNFPFDGPDCVEIVDVNKDGLNDIVACSKFEDMAVWFENRGFNNYIGHIIGDNVGGARSIHTADFDLDGDYDFVVACWDDSKVIIYENIGTEQYKEVVIEPNAGSTRVCGINDIDNDGDMDIVYGSNGSELALFINNGNMNFTKRTIPSLNADGFRFISFGDVNKDGKTDIVTATWNDGAIYLHTNQGSYNFVTTQLYSASQSMCAKPADFDKDGNVDIIWCSYGTSTVGFLKNNGNSSFTNTNIATVNGAYNLSIADIDNDYDNDIFVSSFSDNKVYWIETTSPGNYKKREIFDIAVQSHCIVETDYDKDGFIDAISANPGQNLNGLGNIVFHRNNGTGNFTNTIINSQMTSSIDVAVDDFDKDGDVDVIGASYYNDNIIFYECVYTKKYSPKELVKGLDGLRKICTGDFNNDGLFDIASVSWWDNKVAIHYNLGDMKFKSILLDTFSRVNEKLETKRRPCWCEPVDLNKDGKLDILVAYYGSDEVVWYKNTGSGFTSSVLSKSTDGIECVVTSDIDKDGDIDYATASWEDDKVSWFENVNGKFVEHIISKEVDLASAVNCNDINNDGFIDIVATSYNEDKLYVFENNGKQVFKNELVSNNVNGARNIDVGNLDNIGNKEIVCADWFGFDVKWFTKKGNNYTEALVKNNLACASAVKVVDMDKDGDLDVVTASTVNNKIAWYENKTVNIIKPGLQYPLDESKEILKNTELVWTEVPYATKYKLQISLNKDFSGKVDEVELEATQTKIFNKIYNNENKYFWRVKAFGVVDSSDWSEIYSFETTSKINNSTEEEYLTRIDLEVLPNILENNAVIKISSPGEESATLELIDISGRKIEVIYNGLLRIGENNIDFYRNNLNSGIYFLILKTETEEKSVKIIVK